MLPSGTQVSRFEPSQSHQIFQGEKILSMPSIGGEVKPPVPCRRFAACKRSLQIEWNSLFEINPAFLAHSCPFPARGLSRRMRGGFWRYKQELPKPGSYNKPSWLQYFRRH
jgi:hypothetical protein